MRLTTIAKLQSEVKRINTQLRALEKEGISTSSNWYNWVKRQEFSTVNVIGRTRNLTEQGKENLKLGKELTSNDYQFKLRTDITKMTPREIRKLKDMISFTKQAKTYTIKVTKLAEDEEKPGNVIEDDKGLYLTSLSIEGLELSPEFIMNILKIRVLILYHLKTLIVFGKMKNLKLL